MIFLQTTSIDLSLVRSHVDMTIAALQRQKGGTGEHLSAIASFVEQLEGNGVATKADNLPKMKATFIEKVRPMSSIHAVSVSDF